MFFKSGKNVSTTNQSHPPLSLVLGTSSVGYTGTFCTCSYPPSSTCSTSRSRSELTLVRLLSGLRVCLDGGTYDERRRAENFGNGKCKGRRIGGRRRERWGGVEDEDVNEHFYCKG